VNTQRVLIPRQLKTKQDASASRDISERPERSELTRVGGRSYYVGGMARRWVESGSSRRIGGQNGGITGLGGDL
jgi:hypothetical protein